MKHLRLRGAAALLLPVIALAIACPPSAARAQDTTTEPTTPEPPAESSPETTPATSPTPTSTSETVCNDRRDDDGDGLVDCADAECFENDLCHAGGGEERTSAACSDWIDNDGDQMVDCEDADCQTPQIAACQGSWRGGAQASGGAAGGAAAVGEEDLPELGEGQSVEDLIGRGGDANGERTDELCSDGIDNDFDGRSDCADFGCRFDPQVTVCNGTPGLRFSVVAGVGANIGWDYDQSGSEERITNTPEAGFTLLQLRALGPIPFIENSFFLINVRAEDRVRLTFANFQIPISDLGHYISINSGFGGLSPGLIISAARQPLLDPPFYMYRAFEQGNGAALEVGGPIDERGVIRFRAWGAAGAGEFTGNVGGRFFRSDDRNFAWAAGGAFQFNLIGFFDRFDSPFLYTAVPLTWGVAVGGKYDQRPAERFAATNAFSLLQVWHFSLRVENYTRFVMDDPQTIPVQSAFNVQLGVLLIPRVLFFAADVGGVWQVQPWSTGAEPTSDPSYREQLDTFQWRAALHWYFFRSTGILAVMYREAHNEENPSDEDAPELERELRLEARFRF
ncbi:hypothetical protein [Sandaracinus amylolyticus]|uniref:Tryptophan synthase alpha chain n=1 Tax=Sandaracinus amylolyticus TaxID=927083 RepID=A0A0F6SHG5_9BACT|nr:hypothetical protein [Sandaracinus amylolyticus]AKF10404.1 Tryptophan synthase alpha chain [Sandaracinus amylolyticus]